MKRAAIYARISTLRQDEGMQIADLRELAQRHKWEIVTEYIDKGVSGSKESRAELNKLMKDAKRRKFDVVMVWKFDRFARSLKHLITTLEEFDHLGIDFVSHQEAVDTSTPTGKARRRLLRSGTRQAAHSDRRVTNSRVWRKRFLRSIYHSRKR